MKWFVTGSTNSVHVGILTLNGYNRCGAPRDVLDLHPARIGQDIHVGENSAMAQTFLNQFIKIQGNYRQEILELRSEYIPLKSRGGGI